MQNKRIEAPTPRFPEFLHGGDYNPDQWLDRPDILDRDVELMHKAHVNCVSIGIFSLVRLIRPAQYLINASEFIIPDKECVSATPGDPCELFRSMAFPVTEFAPPPMPLTPIDRLKGGCGCSKD